MKVIILSILAPLSYCMQNDNLGSFGDEYRYEASPLGQDFGLYQSSLQDASSAVLMDMHQTPIQVAPSQPVFHFNEYYRQQNAYVGSSQNLEAKSLEEPWPTLYKPAEYVSGLTSKSLLFGDDNPTQAHSSTSQGLTTTSGADDSYISCYAENISATVPSRSPILTSKDLLFGDQETGKDGSGNNQGFTSIGLLFPEYHAEPESSRSSSSWDLLFGDSIHPNTETATDNPISTTTNLVWTSYHEASPAQQTPRVAMKLKVPAILFKKTLNAVGQVMGKPKVFLKLSIAQTLSIALERFREIFEMLEHADDFSLRIISTNKISDKASVKAALERIRSENVEFQGKRKDAQLLLSVVAERNRKTMHQTQCLKALAELLVRHAMLIYGKIPNVSFDEKDELIVRGEYFPAVEALREYRRVNYENAKKRKPDAPQEQPPAKVQKKTRCKLTSTDCTARAKSNFALMVELHNHVAGHLNAEILVENQSFNSFAPHLIKSLKALIDLAVKRKGNLVMSGIHDDYPVNMVHLMKIRAYFAEKKTPHKFYTSWFLLALDISGASSMNNAEKIYNLANWYAAVAMAVLGSISNVRYENGQVYVDDLPILPHIEERTAPN